MKYDLNILNEYIEKGLLQKNNHPTLPIAIYNYTRECQFLQVWDDITLNMRATVLDNEGNIIARSFPKFFNMEEIPFSLIPNEQFEVYEKMDGSLGILFYYNNEWHLATKGSFTSEQAIRGKQILNNNYDTTELLSYNTYLFEIIYPENRIVVDYGGEEKLVLLGAIENKTGKEMDYSSLAWHSEMQGYPLVKKYDGINDFKQLKQLVKDNQEGFVVRFKNGFRMKIKGEEYVRLHRLLTNFSNVDIWRALKDKTDFNLFLERVPDEFDFWVRNTMNSLQYAHYLIGEHCGKIYDYFRYGKYGDVNPEPTKKQFVEHVEKHVEKKKYHGILFAMWDGNRDKWEDLIWKLLKPKYQKPFWKKDEET